MAKSLTRQIFEKQQQLEVVPPNDVIAKWASNVICVLYPELSTCAFTSEEEIQQALARLREELINMLKATKPCCNCNIGQVADAFFE